MSNPSPHVERFGRVAPRLAANGYQPVPVHFKQKRPVPSEWQSFRYGPEHLQQYQNDGTGLLCGRIVGIDIDIRDEKLANAVDALAEEMLGKAPVRYGQAPKRLRLYQVEGEPFHKMATSGFRLPADKPDDKAHRIEVLAKGQQFVAFNLHPDTMAPYRWNGLGDPLKVPIGLLPAVTREHVAEFMQAAEALLAKHGQRVGKLVELADECPHVPNEKQRAENTEQLRDALRAIPNADLEFDDWLRVCYALKGALGEAGRDDWLAWSATSAKDNPATSAAEWAKARPRTIGAGTIYHLAKAHGWQRQRPAKTFVAAVPAEPVAEAAAPSVSDRPDPLASLRASIMADLQAGAEAIDNAMPPDFVVHKRLPVAGANLAGSGGTGKTTLTLNEYVHITCGGRLYGSDVLQQGPCVLVTAEDGSGYPRYILQRIVADGVGCGALPDNAAARAKASIPIVGWSRSHFGPIANVDRDGNVMRAPGFDVLLELLAPLQPAVVTLDPSALFSPGERFGNDGEAFLASQMHEAALQLHCMFQVLDHVSQAVATSGAVHQHAARGGTAKTDNARLARQLVKFRPGEGDGACQPVAVTAEDIAEGRILQLHWTKLNYAQLPPFAWLRRRGYWIEHLAAPSADDIEQTRREDIWQRQRTDERAVIAHLQASRANGQYLTGRDLESSDVLLPDGRALARTKLRAALARLRAAGSVVDADLPADQVRGARKQYLALRGAR